MKNFIIIQARPDMFMIVPVSEMAMSLEKKCLYHGEVWSYPTIEAAEDSKKVLDKSIVLRGDRPWICPKESE